MIVNPRILPRVATDAAIGLRNGLIKRKWALEAPGDRVLTQALSVTVKVEAPRNTILEAMDAMAETIVKNNYRLVAPAPHVPGWDLSYSMASDPESHVGVRVVVDQEAGCFEFGLLADTLEPLKEVHAVLIGKDASVRFMTVPAKGGLAPARVELEKPTHYSAKVNAPNFEPVERLGFERGPDPVTRRGTMAVFLYEEI